MSGAKGVIIDDIIAGVYSLIIIMFYKIIYSLMRNYINRIKE